MRANRMLFTVLALVLTAATLHADDYLTKDGKLTHPLKITQLQGGFAGFTGTEYTIEPDGHWTTASVFKQKATPQRNGKLTAKELESLAAILSKNDLEKLPAKTGKQPGANPFTLAIEYGKAKANYVGQGPPKLDAADPTASAESRIAAIHQGVVGLLKSGKKAPGSEK